MGEKGGDSNEGTHQVRGCPSHGGGERGHHPERSDGAGEHLIRRERGRGRSEQVAVKYEGTMPKRSQFLDNP
jgi:hypothetical protein